MSKHRNIALFVPHAGCPHQCSFCNQKTISGKTSLLLPEEIDRAAHIALENGKGGEIAFFGGSFTAIDRDYMIELLERAYLYVRSGDFSGIRCSTRPDAVDDRTLEILKSYGVTAIELGAQSMDDHVLALNGRGHTADDTRKAAKRIRSYGIELGLQMMTGLFGDSEENAVRTAHEFIKLKPKTVRIYPTIVLEHTALAELYKQKKYQPQTSEQAIGLCSELLQLFHAHDIAVIRLGLHSGGNVDDGFLAGPYHPAFRELCESRIYLDILKERFSSLPKGCYDIYVAPSEISKLVGQKKSNMIWLRENGYLCRVLPEKQLSVYQIDIKNSKGLIECT